MGYAGKVANIFHGWSNRQKVSHSCESSIAGNNLKFMTDEHYRDLYEIHLRSDHPSFVDFEEFAKMMEQNPGFTMTNKGKVVGGINFGEYLPGLSITIQLSMDSEYQDDWSISQNEYRMLFGYCFGSLQVRRVTGYSINGITDQREKLLQQFGFSYEGTLRESCKHTDGNYYDVKIYGLLKDEQKFLKRQGE